MCFVPCSGVCVVSWILVLRLGVLDTTSLSEEHKICFALEVGAKKHLESYTQRCFAPSGVLFTCFL